MNVKQTFGTFALMGTPTRARHILLMLTHAPAMLLPFWQSALTSTEPMNGNDMTDMTADILHARMQNLPYTTVYAELTHAPSWGAALGSHVPSHGHAGFIRWIAMGIRPGDFMTALLENDLMRAFGRADDENARNMHNWVTMLYNYCPGGAFGSVDIVNRWAESGGLIGQAVTRAEAEMTVETGEPVDAGDPIE